MVETFLFFIEVILVGLGLFGLTMLTNIWWTMIVGSVLGIIAVEKGLAAQRELKLHARVRAVAKRHLPGGRPA